MRAALAALTLLSGCASVAATEQPAPAPASDAKCNAAPAQPLIGRQESLETGAEAQRLSGASRMRWIRPGQMVTMDYREDRLNIDLDDAGRITGLRCG
jgi:hypothetical protein